MHPALAFTALLLVTATALPNNIKPRSPIPGDETVNPAAITGTTCTDAKVQLNSHDINVALLQICGGIAGTIEQCGGQPTSTSGASGDAEFILNAATKGQTIDITKGRWEGCVRAARAVCGDSPFTSTCIGGADVNAGNVDFALNAA